jgi:transposase
LRTKTLGRKEPSMMIIGCDFHPSWQQVSWLDSESGDCGERKLVHANGDAQQFYKALAAPVLIGVEATGNSQWFVELVEDLGHEIWIGDAAQIRPVMCASRRRTSGTQPIF